MQFSVLVAAVGSALPAKAQTPYRTLDLRIGTAHDGQTIPAVGVPFAMTNWTPETQPGETKCKAPYYDKDTMLTGFRGSHWLSGSCTQDYGSVTLMPTTGDLRVLPEQRASRFKHSEEILAPAYYSVREESYDTRVEMSGGTRAGIFRIRFPRSGKPAHLLVQPYAKQGEGFIEVHPDKREIVGYNPVHRIYQGNGKSAGFNGYFVLRLSETPTDYGTWCGAEVHRHTAVQGGGCASLGAYLDVPNDKLLYVKVGTSFTSLDEAEKNLESEIPAWDFDAVRSSTEKQWQHWLGTIDVEGGSREEKQIFYTALYHSALSPRIVSDADGTYNGFAQEGKLHHAAPGTNYYDDFSLWDTFRALHPLITIIDPRREEQMVQSLLDKGMQGGFLPIFPAWGNYTQEMIGDHAVPVIVDAYEKGLRGFDVEEAEKLIVRNAMDTPPHDDYVEGKGRRALSSYMHYGYIPVEDGVADAFHREEQTSRTLEYAYDDFVASRFSRALGRNTEADVLQARSRNWRNVLDPETKFARGRHADGSWVTPFDPAKPARFVTESNPWQYTFFVPHDPQGLIAAVGGREAFIAKLDGLFDRGLYDPGNEPGHAIVYLYDDAGAPHKTQERVHRILTTQYATGASGLPGNDDAGQMSAWYIFSAMGFYPPCPGVPTYSVGAPLFSRIVIHTESGRDFEIRADEAARSGRPSAATLNGQPLSQNQFTHAQLLSGATLIFNEVTSTKNASR